MARKKAPHPDTEFQIRARLVYTASVTVKALTAEEALAKFDSGEWVDDGHDGASLGDWECLGKPEQSYP